MALHTESFRIEATVQVYEPCRVLICLLCSIGIQAGKGAEWHFRKKHKLAGQELAQVLAFVKSKPELCNPATIELPENGSLAIGSLPTHRGFSCTHCQHLTVDKKNIITHQRVAGHEKRTGAANWKVVTLQSFGRQRYARYWVVNAGVEGRGHDETDTGTGASSVVQAVQDCEEGLRKEAEEKRRRVEGSRGVDVESRFVEFMGWAKHLADRDKSLLRKAAVEPLTRMAESRERNQDVVAENRRLRLLAESVDREVQRCTSRIARVPRDTLKWLASVDPSKPVGNPFAVKQEQKTMEWYRSCVRRYLCYCVRIQPLGRKRAYKKHGAVFSDEQWAALQTVVQTLDAVIGGNQAGGEGGRNSESDADRTALDRAVFDYFVCSLRQKLYGDVYVNPLLHFTSVLALAVTDGGWLPCHTFTRFLAGLVWCSRVFMLEHCFAPYDSEDQHAGSGRGSGSDSDSDSDSDSEWEYHDAEQASGEAVEQFEASYRMWIADGSYTPFSTMVSWMAYGRAWRNREGGMPRLAWLSDGTTLSYHGEHIRVGDFQRGAQEAVREVEQLLDELMGGQWACVCQAIPLDKIVDSLVYEGPGKSFATNPKNNWLQPGAGKLAALVGAQLWRQTRAGPSGRIVNECRRQAVEEYFLRLKRFKKLFFGCTHIWEGQPGRGLEISTMKHCDIEQLARNVHVFDGQVMLVTDRDKLASRKGRGRKVARFLPAHLSRVMVAYVAWLLPFEKVLHRMSGIRGASGDLDPWLWKDATKGRWDTEVLSSQLALFSTAHLGVEIKVSSYRHMAIEMGRRIRGIVIRQAEMHVGEDDEDGYVDPATGETRQSERTEYIWDLQATHSSMMARNHYALTVLFPEQLQPEMVLNYQEISRLWHEFLQLTGGQFTRKRGFRYEGTAATGDPGVRGGLLSRPTKKARRSSQVRVYRGAKRAPTDHPIQEGTRGTRPDIDKGLQKMFGAAARWRSGEQRAGMERIMGLRDDGRRGDQLVLVLPTGGGKSIFFMLPSLVEDSERMAGSTSIVVVPFVALMEDLAARASEFGVDCVQWRTSVEGQDREERERDARLVLVSADLAVCDEFISYVDSIRLRGQLRRIYFDECHTVITDVGYRVQLGQLMGLQRFGCPIIMLTATLPVSMEGWFRRQMLCSDASIMRASSAKRNIRYRVDTVRKGGRTALQDAMLRVMGELERRMGQGQKGIVYCRSISDCEALAEQAGCSAYHSRLPMGVRRERLQGWVEGREGVRWVAATSGLGTGIDIRGIVAVLHMQQPYGLVDFVQQTGRGGRRDGEVVDSVIVTDGRPVWYDEFGSDVDQMNREAAERFMRASGCRRVMLGAFMDGEETDCATLGGELCDNCVAGRSEDGSGQNDSGLGDIGIGGGSGSGCGYDNHVHSSPGSTEQLLPANRLQEHRQEEGRALRRLYGWLDEVAGPNKCSVCYIKWHIQGRCDELRQRYGHGRETCRYLPQKEFEAWRRPLQFREFRCCWECGLPYNWCAVARAEGRCVYRNRVLPVVMMGKKSGTIAGLVQEKFGVEVTNDGNFRRWLVRSRWIYGQEMTNGLAVWAEIIKTICN